MPIVLTHASSESGCFWNISFTNFSRESAQYFWNFGSNARDEFVWTSMVLNQVLHKLASWNLAFLRFLWTCLLLKLLKAWAGTIESCFSHLTKGVSVQSVWYKFPLCGTVSPLKPRNFLWLVWNMMSPIPAETLRWVHRYRFIEVIPDNCYGHHGRCPCKNILSGVKFFRLNTKTAYILLFRDIFQCFGVLLVNFWV